MIIDPTTRNNIYNPLSAQGQWIMHRWGKRTYPEIDISLEKVLHALDSISEGFFLFDRPIYLKSAYGDAALWPDVTRISKLVGSGLTVTTYGMIDLRLANMIKTHKSMLHVYLDGYRDLCGKIFQGARWGDVAGLLNDIKSNAMVEFFVYEHNKHQIPSILRFCKKRNIKIKFTPGIKNDVEGSCIIDQYGNWLYDVIPHDLETDMLDVNYGSIAEINKFHDLKEEYSGLEPVPLTRRLENYKSLRTYIKHIEGRSVLDCPMVSKIHEYEALDKQFNINELDYHITPSGHVTTNSEQYSMFVNMLASDWVANNRSVQNFAPYETYKFKMLYYAQMFNNEFLHSRDTQNYFVD